MAEENDVLDGGGEEEGAPEEPKPSDNEPKKSESIDPAQFRKLQRELKNLRKENETLKSGREQNASAEVEGIKKEFESYKGFLEETRDQLIESLSPEGKEELLESLEGLNPLAQIRLLKATAKFTAKQEPKKAPVVERGAPRQTTDANAPRTYGEWLKLPREMRNKYRDLAGSLPD